ncbi:MAG TPA: cobalamin-binding protein [Candidatus Dormibacteraeota bacterium]
MLPSATELLFAVGAGDRVVAVTHECDHPPEGVRRLPRVTSSALPTEGAAPRDIDTHIRAARHAGSSIYNLDTAALERLSPDLIVTQELCDVCAVAYETVEHAVRCLPGDVPIVSLEPRTVDDIVATAVAVGDATGEPRGGTALAAAMRERIAVIAAMVAPEPRPRVVCIEWTDPVFIGGHWVPEMVRLAGGDDVLGVAGEPSPGVEWERVLETQPEVLVLMPCGFDLARTAAVAAEVTARPGFTYLPCARSGRVVATDGSSYFNRSGPRIVGGLEILAAAVRARPGAPLPAGASWVYS